MHAEMQGGLRLTPGAFFANWAATMLTTLVAQTFGLLIGATVMDAKTAQTVTAVIMLTMMLVRCQSSFPAFSGETSAPY